MRFLDDLIIGLEVAAWFVDACLATAIEIRGRLWPDSRRDEPTMLKLPADRRSRLATAFTEQRAA